MAQQVSHGPATRWIYIMGRGHSGSTVLDAMLGNGDSMESVGELIAGMGRYDEPCSCGERFADCGYWAGVRDRFETSAGISWDAAVTASVRQAIVTRLPATLFSRSTSTWVRRLVDFTEGIGQAIGNGGAFVVDSSKDVTRGLFLLRYVPETKVIHLTRHPDGVLWSYYARLKKGMPFKFLRRRIESKGIAAPFLLLACINWTVGNLLAHAITLTNRRSTMRIRFEDLLANPTAEVQRMEQFLGLRLESLHDRIREGKEFDVGHNIGGNRMRMTGRFRFDPVKAVHGQLPLRYRLMARVICWPVMLAYGYR